jgi:Fe-S-cluster containining protein
MPVQTAGGLRIPDYSRGRVVWRIYPFERIRTLRKLKTNTLKDCATCTATDICCSQRVPLSRAEYFRMRRLGAYLGRDEKGRYLMNPEQQVCVFYKQGRCAIYDARPDICRSWHCKDGGETREQWISTEVLVRELRSAGVTVVNV